MRIEPGTVSLTREQARFIGLLVTRFDGTASLDLIDPGGPSPLQVVLYDKTGEVLAEQSLADDDLVLP
jgi:hypothetical protein